MSANHQQVQTLIRMILTRALAYDWTLQGMGFLICRPSPTMRIHVWDSRYRVADVSMVHDHLQWSLSSMIVGGSLTNQKYESATKVQMDDADGWVKCFYRTLRAGAGCHFIDEGPNRIHLRKLPPETYGPGQTYYQRNDEIHETQAEDGTVTLMTKFPEDNDLARVFWPRDKEWVSAEPRAATIPEVLDITSFALHRWFGWTCPECNPTRTCHGNGEALCQGKPVERRVGLSPKFGVKYGQGKETPV